MTARDIFYLLGAAVAVGALLFILLLGPGGH